VKIKENEMDWARGTKEGTRSAQKILTSKDEEKSY
jgi:hypothetical protein